MRCNLAKDNPDFEKVTIKVLRPVEGDRGTELSIVRWIKNGRAFAPQLVNQEVYTDRLDKRRRHGKIKGLKWADLKFIIERKDEILEILLDLTGASQDRAARASSGQDAAANDFRPTFSDDEVPF